MIEMDAPSLFVKLCGEVGNFTKRLTGVSVVDAYFGPKELSPTLQSHDKDAETLESDLLELLDLLREELPPSIRLDFLLGETRSLASVVRWLDDRDPEYIKLVSELFHIKVKKFPDEVIIDTLDELDTQLTEFPDESLEKRIRRLTLEGMIQGDALKNLILGELQQKTVEVGQLFQNHIFSLMGETVPDNGVEYQIVTGQPWSGYNYYMGNFKSVNQFNVDRTFNKYSMISVIYHEYEHHVSNLWREKFYRERGFVDLSIVPLHTGRCVISEGTADTAKDFLGVKDNGPLIKATEIYYRLRRMISINAAIMVNHEGYTAEDTIDYIMEHTFQNRKYASAVMMFIRPENEEGQPNFWAPYVFTYYIGRTDFVLPTFNRAISNDKVVEFYKTVYKNPYSGSSVTWNKAFDWP